MSQAKRPLIALGPLQFVLPRIIQGVESDTSNSFDGFTLTFTVLNKAALELLVGEKGNKLFSSHKLITPAFFSTVNGQFGPSLVSDFTPRRKKIYNKVCITLQMFTDKPQAN